MQTHTNPCYNHIRTDYNREIIYEIIKKQSLKLRS